MSMVGGGDLGTTNYMAILALLPLSLFIIRFYGMTVVTRYILQSSKCLTSIAGFPSIDLAHLVRCDAASSEVLPCDVPLSPIGPLSSPWMCAVKHHSAN